MARKPKTDACWSLSLRGHCFGDGYSSDEDSDKDSAEKPADKDAVTGSVSIPASEDSRLLGELDLAARTDTANYKPNPWSIARANAANRPAKALPPAHNKSAPTRPAKPAMTVLDMLRNQPKKTKPNAVKADETPACLDTALPDSQPLSHLDSLQSPADAELWLEDGAHIPSDETLVDYSFQPSVLIKDTATESVSTVNAPNGQPESAEPDYSDYDTEMLALDANPHDLPGISQPGSRSPLSSGAHGDILESPQYMRPGSSPGNLGRIFDLFCSNRSLLLERLHPLLKSHVKGMYIQKICVWQREWRSPALDSIVSTAPSPPIVHKSHPIVYRTSPFVKSKYSPEILQDDAFSGRSEDSPERRFSLHDQPQREGFHVNPQKPVGIPSGFEFHPSQYPAKNLPINGRPSSLRVSALEIPPPPKQHARSRRQRSPSPRSSPSPPPRTQKSVNASVAQRKRDAYEAFGSPDAHWNTLSAAKKGRATVDNKASAKGRNVFKLPLRVGAALPNRKAEESTPSSATHKEGPRAQVQRRVVTYLPPPPVGAPASTSKSNEGLLGAAVIRSPANMQHGSGERNSDVSSSPSSPFKPLTVRRMAPPTMSLPSYKYTGTITETPTRPGTARPMRSPSRSPGVTVHFNGSGIPERYDIVRRRVARRKRQAEELWDLLDLPSCGVVFRDEWKSRKPGDAEEERNGSGRRPGSKENVGSEIAIVRWDGLRGRRLDLGLDEEG
ncbi:hypothetical protein FKP32DRAFT_1762017 [Trametes sanguinea]|nr:hypothetical protein FKP32DRAFT_1762017 [Trametes sanguinea]